MVKMVKKFKDKLKENGQSLKWFYDNFIKKSIGKTYANFTHQLNGYSPISDEVKKEINKYMGL